MNLIRMLSKSLQAAIVFLLLLLLLLTLQVWILSVVSLLSEALLGCFVQLTCSVFEAEPADGLSSHRLGLARCPRGFLPDILNLCLLFEVADERKRWCRDSLLSDLQLLSQHVLQVLVCICVR